MWNDTLVLILPFSDNSSLTLMLVTVAVVALSSSLFEPCINHISTFIIYGVKLIIVKSVFSSKGVMSFSACLEKEIYILFIKKQMWGKKSQLQKNKNQTAVNAEVAQMSQFYSRTWMQLKFLDLRKVCMWNLSHMCMRCDLCISGDWWIETPPVESLGNHFFPGCKEVAILF